MPEEYFKELTGSIPRAVPPWIVYALPCGGCVEGSGSFAIGELDIPGNLLLRVTQLDRVQNAMGYMVDTVPGGAYGSDV